MTQVLCDLCGRILKEAQSELLFTIDSDDMVSAHTEALIRVRCEIRCKTFSREKADVCDKCFAGAVKSAVERQFP